MHEMLEHPHEGIALARLERRQYQPLRRQDRGLDLPDQPASRRRDAKGFGAAVVRTVEAPDELLTFQPADHVTDGGPVKGNDIAKRCLVDTRMIADGHDGGILHWRDVEALGPLHE